MYPGRASAVLGVVISHTVYGCDLNHKGLVLVKARPVRYGQCNLRLFQKDQQASPSVCRLDTIQYSVGNSHVADYIGSTVLDKDPGFEKGRVYTRIVILRTGVDNLFQFSIDRKMRRTVREQLVGHAINTEVFPFIYWRLNFIVDSDRRTRFYQIGDLKRIFVHFCSRAPASSIVGPGAALGIHGIVATVFPDIPGECFIAVEPICMPFIGPFTAIVGALVPVTGNDRL